VRQETITNHKASDTVGAARSLWLGWEIRDILCWTISTISSRNMQPQGRWHHISLTVTCH